MTTMTMNDVEAILDAEAQRIVNLVKDLGGMRPGTIVWTFMREDGTLGVELIAVEHWLRKRDDDE